MGLLLVQARIYGLMHHAMFWSLVQDTGAQRFASLGLKWTSVALELEVGGPALLVQHQGHRMGMLQVRLITDSIMV